MKKLSTIKIITGLLAIAMTSACTKGLDDVNYDPTKPVTTRVESLLTGAEKSAATALYSNDLNNKVGMLYAQYWAQTQKEDDSRYLLTENANVVLWGLYSTSLSNLDEIVRLNKENGGFVNQVAIANILSVWLYHILTDAYGNIPYTQALGGVNNFTPVYDNSQVVYDSLVKRLDAQIQVLDTAQVSFRSGELIYNGDITKWKKLANSLKLRIGLRMAEVNETKARPVIEAAVASGVLQSAADAAVFPFLATIPDQYPYNEQSGGGIPNEYQVSETLVKYMQEINDPRLPVYARPAKTGGVYKGKPYGINRADVGYGYDDFSYPGTRAYDPAFPGIIMNYDEVEFALAEAAARGFTVPGTAEEHYANGVKASFAFWGIPADSANSYLLRVPYTAADWRNCIGSQKWLALYMQGLQSWFERTRLEFTKPGGQPLFVAPLAGSADPTVSLVPYRLTYPVSESNINKTNYTNAGNAIGGDKKGTQLWWNKE